MVYFKYLTISFVNFTLIKLEGKTQLWKKPKKSNGETSHWIEHTDCKSVQERCSTLLRNANLDHSEITLPIRITKIQNVDNTNCWWECKEIGWLIACQWDYKIVWPSWKAVWQFLKNWTCIYYAIQQLHFWAFITQ